VTQPQISQMDIDLILVSQKSANYLSQQELEVYLKTSARSAKSLRQRVIAYTTTGKTPTYHSLQTKTQTFLEWKVVAMKF